VPDIKMGWRLYFLLGIEGDNPLLHPAQQKHPIIKPMLKGL